MRPGATAHHTLGRVNAVWVYSSPRGVQTRVRFTGQCAGDMQRVTGISSAGPGARVAYKANVSFRLDYGLILQKHTPTDTDSGRANVSLIWVF